FRRVLFRSIIRTAEETAQLQAVRPPGEGSAGAHLQLLVAFVSPEVRLRLAPDDARRIPRAGEVDVVQGVPVNLQRIERLVEFQGRLLRVAHADLRLAVVA